MYGLFALALVAYILLRHQALGFFLTAPGAGGPRLWYPGERQDFSRVATVFKVGFFYLRTLLYPVQLGFESRLPPSDAWTDPHFLVAASVVCGMTLYCLVSLFTFSRAGFGLLWFLLATLPVSQIIALNDLAMEHFLYLPSAGICLAAAVAINGLLNANRSSNFFRRFAALCSVSIMLCLLVLTWQRNLVWNNQLNFWRETVRQAPLKARGLDSLGMACYAAGDRDRARHWFLASADLLPADPINCQNLVGVLVELDRLDEAQSRARQCLMLDPSIKKLHNQLGVIWEKRRNPQMAAREFEAELELDPDSALALENLGLVRMELKECDAARQALDRLGPRANDSFRNLVEAGCPK